MIDFAAWKLYNSVMTFQESLGGKRNATEIKREHRKSNYWKERGY